MRSLNNFFSPKSIAIVGASPKKGKLGNVLVENIKRGGWKGKIYYINPKYAKKNAAYLSSLSEIKKPVDLVLVAIPAPFVNEVIENGAKARPAIKNYVVISSGFKETGNEGKKLEDSLEKIAEKYNLNILGPNCLGFANPEEKLNATFTSVKLQRGNTAIVSQSGALAVALLDWAENKNIGFSKIISIGNKTDLDESEIMSYLANDPQTKIIALYLEDIKNGQSFMQALAKTTPKKPVIILKAGKTITGQKAVSSHTGSLAQDGEIIEAVLEKFNVIPVDNMEEFQDCLYYLSSNSIAKKNGMIVLTNAGGPGVMASDFIGKSKTIKLLNFSDDFKIKIKKNLPASASVENPIDLIGDAPPERYREALNHIAKYFPDNPVVAILTPQNQTDPEKVAMILSKYKNKIPNLSACFMGGKKIDSAKKYLEKNGIANFENPERALSAIEKVCKYQRNRKNIFGVIRSAVNDKMDPALQKASLEGRKILFWKESEKIFSKNGVRLTHSLSFENISELKTNAIFFPCAFKTDDPNIAHRLEKNAVALNIQDEKELKRNFKKIQKSTGAKHFLVQPMAEAGLEIILGMKRDPVFGPVLLAGWGGSFTELFKDRVILIPPFGKNEIKDKLSQLTIFPVLKGFRGKRGYNLDEICKIILAVGRVSFENPEIREIDINPLVVYNNGKPAQILDAKIFLM